MYDVPKEFVDIKQKEIDARVNELWEELIQQANGDRDIKKCREILDLIDLNNSQSILLWRV